MASNDQEQRPLCDPLSCSCWCHDDLVDVSIGTPNDDECNTGDMDEAMRLVRVTASEDEQAHLADNPERTLCGKTVNGFDLATKPLCAECIRDWWEPAA